MSNSNTTNMDQPFDSKAAAELRDKRKQKIASTLAKRHRKEKAFRMFGFSSVVAGLLFVASRNKAFDCKRRRWELFYTQITKYIFANLIPIF